MEVKDIIQALDPKLGEIKAQVASEVAAIETKHAATVAQLNEDAQKNGQSLAMLQEKVNGLIATNGKLTSAIKQDAFADRQKSLKGAVMELVAENFEAIKSERPFNAMKDVANMTLSNNLTGTSQISYVDSPILRAFFNPHLYDVFRIIPTATGNVTFPRGNTSIGEGSFGTQTEGSAKAQVDYDVTMVNTSLSFIAGYARVSRQMLQEPFVQLIPQLRAHRDDGVSHKIPQRVLVVVVCHVVGAEQNHRHTEDPAPLLKAVPHRVNECHLRAGQAEVQELPRRLQHRHLTIPVVIVDPVR